MGLLIAGIALWVAAHFFKRLMPRTRASMGNAGKGLVALLTLASIVMMVVGYRAADSVAIYTPMAGMGHLNNLLMILALFLFGAGSARGVIEAKMRHPMMWGMVIWAGAHLLVNGDGASLILFGGLGLWALVQMQLINRGDGPWQRSKAGPIARDLRNFVIALMLFAIISGVHLWLGYSPFKGTYG